MRAAHLGSPGVGPTPEVKPSERRRPSRERGAEVGRGSDLRVRDPSTLHAQGRAAASERREWQVVASLPPHFPLTSSPHFLLTVKVAAEQLHAQGGTDAGMCGVHTDVAGNDRGVEAVVPHSGRVHVAEENLWGGITGNTCVQWSTTRP